MPTPTKRIRKEEANREHGSAEAKTRLIKARRSSVGSGSSWPRHFKSLTSKLRRKIRGGTIQIADPTKGEFDFQAEIYGPNQRMIGYAGAEIKVEQQKLGLYIENLQGEREKNMPGFFYRQKNY